MATRDTFHQLAETWREHCQKVAYSSRTEDYLDHPAYRELVKLGPQTVPWIMNLLSVDSFVPWESVLQKVTGTRLIEHPNDFDPEEVRQKRLDWWSHQQTTQAG